MAVTYFDGTFGLSAGSLGVFAENPPLPSESDIQKESTIDASKRSS